MENNKFIIISFNTTTDAMAFEKFCIGNKIGGKLISVPKEIDAGCGLAWEIKIRYDESNNANIERENFNLKEDKEELEMSRLDEGTSGFKEDKLKLQEDKLKQEYDNSILEKIEIKKLNEIKDMVNSNNLKFDKIVVFEKNKK